MSTAAAASLSSMLHAAREASRPLATLTAEQKNAGLEAIATAVAASAARVLPANDADLERGRAEGMSTGLQDRLRLDESRLSALADAVRSIAALPDPVGETVRGHRLPNGVSVQQVRVPFGVVGAIYEARPNVTIDIAALALKSGNAVVLRGGSAALETNRVLVAVIRDALQSVGLPSDAVQTIDDFGRAGAAELMRARGLVDLLIPRGSAELIATVVEQSTVPVIETGAGVVHIFLDASARTDWAVDIVRNAKVQRPSVCNAVETLLVHRDAAERLLGPVLDALSADGVTLYVDERSVTLGVAGEPANDDVWSTEHMALELGVKIVDSLDEALEHIRRYSTQHTEAIVTDDAVNAERFLAEVDSAVVMVNTSTRFTDGGEFGFGAEVGISTQKLHARGPMGVSELTSSKWIVRGAGQVRR